MQKEYHKQATINNKKKARRCASLRPVLADTD